MRTLYLRNVPDEVVRRLEVLAAQAGTSVAACAVRELTEATRRADRPALLEGLPTLACLPRRSLTTWPARAMSGDLTVRLLDGSWELRDNLSAYQGVVGRRLAFIEDGAEIFDKCDRQQVLSGSSSAGIDRSG